MDGCEILLWLWWALQNLMKQAKFVAYEQNVIVYTFLTLKLCFDTMALLAWWSAPEAKVITKFNKKLQTITFCSNATNFACFIKFWSDHHVPWKIWHRSLGERQIHVFMAKKVATPNIYGYGSPISCMFSSIIAIAWITPIFSNEWPWIVRIHL